MEQYRESDIRNQVENWLKQQGIPVEREVSCGNGIRADLVTPDTVIEVKKVLNRGAIYQAHGQGVAYQKHLNKPNLMIVGFAPASETRYQEAQRIAENIRAEGVEVIFLDKDPQWIPAMAAMTIPVAIEPVAAAASAAKPAPPAEKSAPAKPPTQSEKSSESSDRLSFGMRDMWALLLIILLFLWVRSTLVTADRAEEYPTQPNPQQVRP